MIPFLNLSPLDEDLREELLTATAQFLDSGRYMLGEGLAEFEDTFASYVGVDHCVGVASGLDAISLLLRAYNIGPGDEVIVPSNTYIATWLAVTHVGATPVPVEPDESTYNLDPSLVEAALTPRTRAILPVHLYGQPADVAPLMGIASRRNLAVIEDAAQAHGARYRGRQAGSLAHAAAFSFYPTKNLGAYGDGGAVTTDDPEVAKTVRLLRNYGSPGRGRTLRLGYNSRLDELQARLLTIKLSRLDDWNGRRRHQAAIYREGLAGTDLVLPAAPSWAEPSWHVFVVQSMQRDDLASHLARHGVETLIHYPVPPHLQPAYEHLGMTRGSFPLSELLHQTVLSLPIGPHLSCDDVRTVIAAVRRATSEPTS